MGHTSEHGRLSRLCLTWGRGMRERVKGVGRRTEEEDLDRLVAFLVLFPGLFDGIVDFL